MDPTAIDHLVFDLVDPIVTLAIRLVLPNWRRSLPPPSGWAAENIRSLLNVCLLPNAAVASLLVFPWVDLTVAARLGNLWLCKCLLSLKRFRPLQYSTKGALQAASAEGHLHVLDWWVNVAQLPLDVGGGGLESAMTAASRAGHVAVLEWWTSTPQGKLQLDSVNTCTHGLPVATDVGHAQVLRWWQHASLPMVVDGWFLRPALLGHLDVFQWWTDFDAKGKVLKRSSDHLSTILAASMFGGHLSIVEHMLTFGVNPKRDKRHAPGMQAFSFVGPQWAYASGNLEFVQQVKVLHTSVVGAGAGKTNSEQGKLRSRQQPNYSLAVFLACAFGHTHLLDYLDQGGRRRDAVRSAATTAMAGDAWLLLKRLHRLPSLPQPPYPPELGSSSSPLMPLDVALVNGHTHVLEWWLAHQLPFRGTTQPLSAIALCRLSAANPVDLLNWWAKHCPHTPAVSDLHSAYVHAGARPDALSFLTRLKSAYPGFSKIPRNICDRVLVAAASRGHLATLQGWLPLTVPLLPSAQLPDHFPAQLVDTASALGHVHVLEWLRAEGHLDRMQWTQAAVDCASQHGHVAVLAWWRDACQVDRHRIRYSAQAWAGLDANPDPMGVVGWWLEQAQRGDGNEWGLHVFKVEIPRHDDDEQLDWMHLFPGSHFGANHWVKDACARGLTVVMDACLHALRQHDNVQVAVELVKIAVKAKEVSSVAWAVERLVQQFGTEVMAHQAPELGRRLKETSMPVREWWDREIGPV